MATQSWMSRLGARALPIAAKQAFPESWVAAGDDQAKLTSIAAKRRRLDGPRPDAALRRRWVPRTSQVAGRDLHILTPKSGSTGRLLFHCHGGAFVFGPSGIEWLSIAALAHRIGADLALYDYPKVPETNADATLATTWQALETVLHDYDPASTVISGVSAGGGLAVSMMFHLGDEGRPMPAGAILLSPWLDMSISHPEAEAQTATELLLPISVLRRDGELYASDRGTTDPMISARFADRDRLAGLPPMMILAGEQEILLPEAQEFADNARAAGVDVTVLLEPFGQHAGAMIATPEAKPLRAAAVDAARRWLAE